MAFTQNINKTLLILTLIVVLLPLETYAFGAGDIPDFAYLNDKAFRHGDIENILENLVKSVGGATAGSGLLGFAKTVLTQASGGAKFTKSDIKKVYFGNWLRDYSQAMDIAGLSKLTADSLILIVSVLGFMTFGFATEEFQVTADRLSVYMPVEHIDNPKGYGAKEGDPRKFHPKLRPPVDDRELEFDERTGMKNYMATEGRGWDTSTAFIRRTLRACIEAGRRAGGREGADLWEAYRLLGTGLHTLEDLLAHSNWCEVALRKMGHQEVFCHVGDNVVINTPNGRAPPLVTGTFGGADFIHSLMGEATDKLSQASVTDLSTKMDQASQGDNNNVSALKSILSKLPIGGSDDKMNQGEEIHAQAKAYNFNPDNIAPPEVQQQLFALLKWRDSIYRDVLAKIEMVPGLSNLIDELTNALNAYVYTVLSPYIAPILQQATGVLGEGSKAVIDSEDQFEVFNNADASDPTHSFLSKDHFGLILNEPAGKIAQIVVTNSVNLIVPAWANNNNPDQIIDQILEAFHHPYYATGRSNIQHQMFDHMQAWIGGLGPDEAQEIIQSLTKESVRNGRNKRPGSENETQVEAGYGGHSHGGSSYKAKSQVSGNAGYESQQGQYGGSRTETSYSQGHSSYSSGPKRDDRTSNTYSAGGDRNPYAESQNQGGYGSRQSDNNYSSGHKAYGESEPTSSYGQENNSYSRGQKRDNYGSNTYNTGGGTYGETQNKEDYGFKRQDNNYPSGRVAYGEPERTDSSPYGQESSSYSMGQKHDDYSSNTYNTGESRSTYGETQNQGSYGSKRSDNDFSSGRTAYGKPEYTSSRQHHQDSAPYDRSQQSGDDISTTYGSGQGSLAYGGASQNEGGYGSGVSGGYSSSRATYGESERTSAGYGGSAPGVDRYDPEKEEKHHGSRHHRKDDEDDNRGSRRHREEYSSQNESSGYTPSYGQSEVRASGYGEGNQYSSHDSRGEGEITSGYGTRTESSYRSPNVGTGEYSSSGYGSSEPSYGGRQYGSSGETEGSSGYAPKYGGSIGETFGAERLNIQEDDDDEHGRRHHGHHGKKGRSNEYGGNY